LLDRVLSPTIFSTQTNRRIFRGMVYVADTESWQRIFQLMTEKSRWDLPDEDVSDYLARSFDFVIDFIRRFDRAEAFGLDPAGTKHLRMAKRVRREALRIGGEELLRERAAEYFGLPVSALGYARQLPAPLYLPNRSDSN
ncbi:MAG: hypothetical protein M3282_09205, partial [Gemmatimonadota bacterium]|nr:hypothetical protein [Gemmatimonadota bacterium]